MRPQAVRTVAVIRCTVCGHGNPAGTEYCEGPSCGAYLPHQWAAERPVGIAVELAADAVSVSAGHEADCAVRVEDLGSRGGRVALEVLGPLAPVTSAEPQELDLPAGGHADGRVTLRPAPAMLGRHQLRVRARLVTDPAVTAEDASSVVVVAEPPDVPTEVVPLVPARELNRARTDRRVLALPPGAQRRPPQEDGHANWWRAALLALAAVVVVAVAAGLLRDRRADPPDDDGADRVAEASRLEQIPLDVPLVHDPPRGDGTENDQLLPFVVDGDLSTAWVSEGYVQSHMNLKSGVGLFLRLPPGSNPLVLRVLTPSTGWGARVYLTQAAEPGVPASLEQRSPEDGSWGEPVAGAAGISGSREFELPGSEATGVLLWLQAGEEADGRYRVRVAEAIVLEEVQGS